MVTVYGKPEWYGENWHKVSLDTEYYYFSTLILVRRQAIEWCEEKLGKHGNAWFSFGADFYFEKQEDAVAFRLIYG